MARKYSRSGKYSKSAKAARKAEWLEKRKAWALSGGSKRKRSSKKNALLNQMNPMMAAPTE